MSILQLSHISPRKSHQSIMASEGGSAGNHGVYHLSSHLPRDELNSDLFAGIRDDVQKEMHRGSQENDNMQRCIIF